MFLFGQIWLPTHSNDCPWRGAEFDTPHNVNLAGSVWKVKRSQAPVLIWSRLSSTPASTSPCTLWTFEELKLLTGMTQQRKAITPAYRFMLACIGRSSYFGQNNSAFLYLDYITGHVSLSFDVLKKKEQTSTATIACTLLSWYFQIVFFFFFWYSQGPVWTCVHDFQ